MSEGLALAADSLPASAMFPPDRVPDEVDWGFRVSPPTRSVESPKLSIVLATLNEVENIPTLLREIRLQELPPFEIIVVDDGSTDGTRERLLDEAGRDPRIRPIFHDGRQTLVPAHCQGIDAARGDYVVVMDADRQHPAKALPLIVRSLEQGAVLAIASRYAPGGSPGPRSALRGAVSRAAETTAKILVAEARTVSDPTSGFYGFRRQVFVPLDPMVEGYELLPFLLVMCNGFPKREIPYRFEPRRNGESKIVQKKLDFVVTFLSEMQAIRRWKKLIARRREETLVARIGSNLSLDRGAPISQEHPTGMRGR